MAEIFNMADFTAMAGLRKQVEQMYDEYHDGGLDDEEIKALFMGMEDKRCLPITLLWIDRRIAYRALVRR